MDSATRTYEKLLQHMQIDTDSIPENEYQEVFEHLKSKGVHHPINLYRVNVDAPEFWPRYCAMKRSKGMRIDTAPSDQDRIELENKYIEDILTEYRRGKTRNQENRIEKTAI